MRENKINFNDKPIEELNELKENLSKEIFQLKNELSLHRKLEKPHLLRLKKKHRAQVLCALTQKKKSS